MKSCVSGFPKNSPEKGMFIVHDMEVPKCVSLLPEVPEACFMGAVSIML